MELRNMSLYSLNDTLQTAIIQGFVLDDEGNGEILFDSENIDQLELAVTDKVEAYAVVRDYYEKLAAQAKAESDRLKELSATYSKFANALEPNMLKSIELMGGKVETSRYRVSTRKSESIEILDESEIPPEFMTQPKPPAPKPNKVAIKKAIKDGESVPGAALVKNTHLVVK